MNAGATMTATMKTGAQYRWRLLRAGPLWLDGGSMFGVVPRAVWSKNVPFDEQGRIEVAHNCLLLERGDQRIVIEVGSGDKFDAKSRTIFGLSDRSIADAVEETGLHCDQIQHVIVTHLHFDHAGGLTCRPRAGEAPGPKPTFSNAQVIVQRQEWEDALANRSVMTRTYLRDHLDPIRQQLRLIDSPPPFSHGYRPERDELPPRSLHDRLSNVLPGIDVFLVPGHTWGQQAVRFTDDRGRTVVFTPDVLPTINHVGAAYNMAYDVEPYISTVTRHWFLDAAVENDWLLVLDHEPGNPCQRVRRDGKGWHTLQGEPQ
jgi:glyoxylase-like metal-dependent hydrolase (beta-lactamase superfamily II)